MSNSTHPQPAPAVADTRTPAADGAQSGYVRITGTLARPIFVLWTVFPALAALMLAVTSPPGSTALPIRIGLFATVSVCAAWMVWRPPAHLARGVTLLLAGSLLAHATNLSLNGTGLASPGLIALPLTLMLYTVLVGRLAPALAATALCIAGMLALGWQAHVSPPDPAAVPLARSVLAPVLALVGGLLGGLIIVRALRESLRVQGEQVREELYQRLFRDSPAPQLLHRDGVVIAANDAAAELLGYSGGEEMEGVHMHDHLPPGADRQLAAERLQLIKQRSPDDPPLPMAAYNAITRTGQALKLRVSATVLEYQGHQALLAAYIDDTAQSKAERKLQESQALLQQLIQASPLAISLTNLQTGKVLLVNSAFERITGYRSDEIVGRDSAELKLWKSIDERDTFRRATLEAGTLINARIHLIHKNGQERLLEGASTVFRIDQTPYLVVMQKDVTEEWLIELRRRTVMDTVPVGVFAVTEGTITLCSRSLERMVGWPEGTGAGRSVALLVGGDAALQQIIRQTDEALRRGELAVFEWPLHNGDGEPFTARFTGRAIDQEHPDSRQGLVWIVQDVSEEIERRRLLERARHEAEAMAQAKSRFLVHTSHQLRTPLNAILSLAELASAGDTNTGQREDLVRHIADSAQSLARMLSDIMDLQLLEDGELQLQPAPFDLGALADAVRTHWMAQAAATGQRLSVHLGAGTDRWVQGDAQRLRQLLGCFLSNALRYGGTGSIVLRLLAVGDERYRFEVQDHGLGMAADDQTQLFAPFPVVGEASTLPWATPGMGLGLAIARRLASAMGGRIGMVSALGQGSTFWVELPLAPASAPADPSTLSETPLLSVRLLLAEDDELSATSLAMLLQQWGAHVDTVGDGAQAVRAVATAREDGRPYDLVLMDLSMPLMDGLEAVRWIREQLEERTLPVIALTAGLLNVELHGALAAGCSDFLSKPVPSRQLLERIVAQLARPAQPQSRTEG